MGELTQPLGLTPDILQAMIEKGSLRRALNDERPPEWPTIWTFLRWVKADRQIAQQYAQARELLEDRWADEILDIADDGRNDTYTDEKGNTKTDWDVVGRSKLRVDTRKWLLSKLRPGQYGDKLLVGHVGQVEFVIKDERPELGRQEVPDHLIMEVSDGD